MAESPESDLARIQSRVAGRKEADALWEFIEHQAHDKEFMRACIETLINRAGLSDPTPEPEKHEPIARLGLTTIPFGQYNGQPFDEIPLDYLNWLCGEQEDFYRTLRAYLKHPQLQQHRGEYDDVGEDEAAEELERHIREG